MGTRRDVASRRSAPSGHVATTTLQRGPFSRCQKVPFLLAISNQWEARKRCPSLVFWCRIMDLDPALPDVAKTAGLSPPPPDH